MSNDYNTDCCCLVTKGLNYYVLWSTRELGATNIC